MKKLLTIFILLISTTIVFAQNTNAKNNTLPQGIFKKKHNGQVVQYDNKGKKIGIYKIKNGKYVKIK